MTFDIGLREEARLEVLPTHRKRRDEWETGQMSLLVIPRLLAWLLSLLRALRLWVD